MLFTLMDECALFSDLMKAAYRIFVVADPVFKRRMDKLRITTPGVVRVMLSPEYGAMSSSLGGDGLPSADGAPNPSEANDKVD